MTKPLDMALVKVGEVGGLVELVELVLNYETANWLTVHVKVLRSYQWRVRDWEKTGSTGGMRDEK